MRRAVSVCKKVPAIKKLIYLFLEYPQGKSVEKKISVVCLLSASVIDASHLFGSAGSVFSGSQRHPKQKISWL